MSQTTHRASHAPACAIGFGPRKRYLSLEIGQSYGRAFATPDYASTWLGSDRLNMFNHANAGETQTGEKCDGYCAPLPSFPPLLPSPHSCPPAYLKDTFVVGVPVQSHTMSAYRYDAPNAVLLLVEFIAWPVYGVSAVQHARLNSSEATKPLLDCGQTSTTVKRVRYLHQ